MGDQLSRDGRLGPTTSRGKIKPQPTTFFDILVEQDVSLRKKKITAAAEASMEMAGGLDDVPSSATDPPYDVMGNLPEFLQELAGGIYVDMANVHMGKRLGEGGFAVVNKAELKTADGTHTVAIKALKPGVIENDEEMKELIQEANLLRKVHHKYIVSFCGVGCSMTKSVASMRSSVFFAEEFMAGGTLKHRVMQMKESVPCRYRLADALRWCMQIAEALSYMHNCTPVIVHRDLKPENVLLTTKDAELAEAKIADFGLHKRLSKVHKRRNSTDTLNKLKTMLQSMEDAQEEASKPKDGRAEEIKTAKSGQVTRLAPKLSRGVPKWRPEEDSLDAQRDERRRPSDVEQQGLVASPEAVEGGAGAENGEKRKKTKHRRKRRGKIDGSVLGDVGSVAGSTVTGVVGSLMYMAPEVLHGTGYDEKVDVFGFAVIMYELFRMELTVTRLTAKCETLRHMRYVIRRYALSVSRGLREPIPRHWPPAVRALIHQSWCQDPKQRPTIRAVLEKLTEIGASGVVEQMDAHVDSLLEEGKGPSACRCCVIS